MKQFKIICALLVSVIMSIPIGSLASEKVVDGPVARNQIKITVQSLFYQEKFAELESMADEFRKSKARLPEGVWKLQFFYEGLGTKDRSPEGWKKLFGITEKWLKQSPDSITARVVAAGAWIDFGGEARGKGYADSVSDEGWRILAASNEKAFKLLEAKSSEGTDDCPQRYYYLLTIARSQGWGRAQFEYLFNEAVTFEPTYYSFYIIKAKYLLPRWYGEDGEWQQFAEDAVRLTPESEGKSAYMRIVGSLLLSTDITSPSDPRLSWSLLKQGYLDVEQNFPNSRWNLNVFCKWASKFGDKETARQLFKRIGDDPYIEAWGGRAEYDRWRKWAGEQM